MRAAGLLVSIAGHAGVIALALWGLPWLRVRPEPQPPAVAVSLVSPAEFAALAARPAPASEAPEPKPPPATPEPPRPAAPRHEPLAEPEDAPEPEVPDLAPGFDAVSPLGFRKPDPDQLLLPEPKPEADSAAKPLPTTTLIDVDPPRPRPEPPSATESASRPAPPAASAETAAPGSAAAGGTEAMSRYEAALHSAIDRALIMPRVVRDRGLNGTVRLELSIGRDGRLLRVRIAEPSGSGAMDAAALAAARRADLPAAPPEVAGGDVRFVVGIDFTTTDF